jgi:hypothetical protein
VSGVEERADPAKSSRSPADPFQACCVAVERRNRGESLVTRNQTLREQARIRGGREGARRTEDEIAKSRLGEQGVPEQPAKPAVLDQDEMQNPKPLDPGHTA